MAWPRLSAATICLVTVALSLTGVVLAVVEPDAVTAASDSGGVTLAVFEAVVYTAFAVVGVMVTVRQPRNAVGWLLQLIPVLLAVTTVADLVYFRTLFGDGDFGTFTSYLTWILTWAWTFAVPTVFTLIPLLFPTGRPPGPRWRPLVGLAVVGIGFLWFGTAFAPGPLVGYPAVDNPLGIDSPAVARTGQVAFAGLALVSLGAIASAVVRYRRSVGVERQQLKWVALALVVLPLAVLTPDDNLGFAILLGGLFLVVLAVGLAMLRYRLYDVDVVINRALVYGGLTATLAAAYLAVVLTLQFALRPITDRSDLAVAASTLAVAALFGPARRRIQAFVDRRFYRRRYDAARTAAAFGGRLRAQVDLDALRDDLGGVVRETVAPTHVSLWVRP